MPEQDAEDGAEAALGALIESGAVLDGLMMPIDGMATGAMRALRVAGLSVPGDVRGVTRYDGLRARSESPPLTAVDLQLDRVSSIATRSPTALIKGSLVASPMVASAPRLLPSGSSLSRHTASPSSVV